MHDVVKDGWSFKRNVWSHDFKDGQKSDFYFGTDWGDDTSFGPQQRLTPDIDDKIYDRDAPDVGAFGATNCLEVNSNFRQWIEWNGQPAVMQFTYWSWKAKWKAGGLPKEVILKQVSGTLITLPDNSEGCG